MHWPRNTRAQRLQTHTRAKCGSSTEAFEHWHGLLKTVTDELRFNDIETRFEHFQMPKLY